MKGSAHHPDVVANFWEWDQRRQEREQRKHQSNPLTKYAIDKCEEALRHSEWDRFGYWFSIYRRERPHASKFDASKLQRPR